ncbi:ABC transporter substrate-binding protein [Chelatococcus reniformis]|uniref:ABC transporter substrate-binding protein n=1 Tax=Chelatococcus reniformis TaxID=1494448 RepID=A0A916TYH7_9HYPH|nr:ABC transporter substrate-binding protein [Chelatococcus reniformis]GGC49200.1 ABC transporter substrate-binding protein [Chelatococcus reniformis]
MKAEDGCRLRSTRRGLLKGAAAWGALGVAGPLAKPALAQAAPLRVGLMLPYTGTYAKLGQFCDQGFRLFVEMNGGKLGGREISFVQVDDESKPETATDNMNRLVSRDKVDVVVGTVHSGVAMAMVKVARDTKTLLLIPNAGANDATGPLCAPNIFRTSFSNWQVNFPMGKVIADAGHKKVVTITWRYTAGQEMMAAFKEGFAQAGGTVVEELALPFPEVEFQALLTRIASIKPDAVHAFFAGGGAVKFVRDYAAAGLKGQIPLYGPGFLTDGTLKAQGEAAEGIRTTLHYADDLDNPANKTFLAAFAKKTSQVGDIYAVQGYDAAALLAVGLGAVGGDFSQRDGLVKAMGAARLDSPRGPVTFNKAHNPIQNIYLRDVRNGINAYVAVAQANVDDPARGCRIAT